MGLQFDNCCFFVGSLTLSDIKEYMEKEQKVWDFVNANFPQGDPMREDFEDVLILAAERIAALADSKGFDDINELEAALMSDKFIVMKVRGWR